MLIRDVQLWRRYKTRFLTVDAAGTLGNLPEAFLFTPGTLLTHNRRHLALPLAKDIASSNAGTTHFESAAWLADGTFEIALRLFQHPSQQVCATDNRLNISTNHLMSRAV